jgi:hypothetical protein
MVVVSLPGGLLWLLARRKSAKAKVEIPYEKHGFS